MNSFTSILYARPSFLEGVARIFDFCNVLQRYNIHETSEEADEHALLSDWYAIGEDMKSAVREVARQASERELDEQEKQAA